MSKPRLAARGPSEYIQLRLQEARQLSAASREVRARARALQAELAALLEQLLAERRVFVRVVSETEDGARKPDGHSG